MVTQHGYCHTEKYPHPELDNENTKCKAKKENYLLTCKEKRSVYGSFQSSTVGCVCVCAKINFDKINGAKSSETSVSTKKSRTLLPVLNKWHKSCVSS